MAETVKVARLEAIFKVINKEANEKSREFKEEIKKAKKEMALLRKEAKKQEAELSKANKTIEKFLVKYVPGLGLILGMTRGVVTVTRALGVVAKNSFSKMAAWVKKARIQYLLMRAEGKSVRKSMEGLTDSMGSLGIAGKVLIILLTAITAALVILIVASKALGVNLFTIRGQTQALMIIGTALLALLTKIMEIYKKLYGPIIRVSTASVSASSGFQSMISPITSLTLRFKSLTDAIMLVPNALSKIKDINVGSISQSVSQSITDPITGGINSATTFAINRKVF